MSDDQPLLFGKYVGKTPKEVLEEDPSYIVWLFDNIENQVSQELYEEALDKMAEEPDTYDVFTRGR